MGQQHLNYAIAATSSRLRYLQRRRHSISPQARRINNSVCVIKTAFYTFWVRLFEGSRPLPQLLCLSQRHRALRMFNAIEYNTSLYLDRIAEHNKQISTDTKNVSTMMLPFEMVDICAAGQNRRPLSQSWLDAGTIVVFLVTCRVRVTSWTSSTRATLRLWQGVSGLANNTRR